MKPLIVGYPHFIIHRMPDTYPRMDGQAGYITCNVNVAHKIVTHASADPTVRPDLE